MAMIGSAMLHQGIQTDKQIGLAGFDADPASAILHVPLTLAKQQIIPFVNAAYETAQRALSNACVPGEQVIIPTELEINASTQR